MTELAKSAHDHSTKIEPIGQWITPSEFRALETARTHPFPAYKNAHRFHYLDFDRIL